MQPLQEMQLLSQAHPLSRNHLLAVRRQGDTSDDRLSWSRKRCISPPVRARNCSVCVAQPKNFGVASGLPSQPRREPRGPEVRASSLATADLTKHQGLASARCSQKNNDSKR